MTDPEPESPSFTPGELARRLLPIAIVLVVAVVASVQMQQRSQVPEGTRVPPGQKRRYKLGGAILAEHTGYPVVPVAHDSGDYWPRNSFFKFPGTIRLVIGPTIETEGLSAAEINAKAETWIEATVERLRAS